MAISQIEKSFTPSQHNAMRIFFEKYGLDLSNLNNIDAVDQIWEQCIDHLINHYNEKLKEAQLNFNIKQTSKRTINLLESAKKLNNLKEFFQNHVITSVNELHERAVKFAQDIELYQKKRYTCLIPSNTECYVDFQMLITTTVDKKAPPERRQADENGCIYAFDMKESIKYSKKDVSVISTTDILLMNELEDQKVSYYQIEKRGREGGGGALWHWSGRGTHSVYFIVSNPILPDDNDVPLERSVEDAVIRRFDAITHTVACILF